MIWLLNSYYCVIQCILNMISGQAIVTNTITNDKFPKYSKSLIPNYQSMVEILGRNIEEDFLI